MPDENDALAIVPRRRDLVRRLGNQLRTSTAHQRFAPIPLPWPDWSNHTSQRHIRDVVIDPQHDAVWMATWGGILCWFPSKTICIRHTSEHGLAGNATRAIAVDETGHIWAVGESGGLCWLDLDGDAGWHPYADLKPWRVLCLAPRRNSGMYMALHDSRGNCAIGEITSPQDRLCLLMTDGLAVKDVDALWSGIDDTLWIGNAWGLHRRAKDGILTSFLDGKSTSTEQVCVIVGHQAGELWIGTRRGLFCFRPNEQPLPIQAEGWPRAEIISLSVEPETGCLWVITSHEVGYVTDNLWQPLSNVPRDRLNALVARKGHAWAGGRGGLYDLSPDSNQPAFSLLAADDGLSNAVQCLYVDSSTVWAGTAQGLACFDEQVWRAVGQEPPYVLRDVRALMPGSDVQLWIGAWAGGPAYVAQDTYVPNRPVPDPILALASGEQGESWAATPDSIYRWQPMKGRWESVQPPATQHIGSHIIQTICFQQTTSPGEAHVPTLWVGTSDGLWRYRPDLQLWDAPADWGAPDELSHLSIQALALNPQNNQLWIGTSSGLYSQRQWKCYLTSNVCAFAFDVTPPGMLWVGTRMGLEQWPIPSKGQNFPAKPTAHFTPANSGLGAEAITALAVRAHGIKQEVWIGTPAGISVYCYHPKK
jgi:ligand-binding sensor domain-containing protein